MFPSTAIVNIPEPNAYGRIHNIFLSPADLCSEREQGIIITVPTCLYVAFIYPRRHYLNGVNKPIVSRGSMGSHRTQECRYIEPNATEHTVVGVRCLERITL